MGIKKILIWLAATFLSLTPSIYAQNSECDAQKIRKLIADIVVKSDPTDYKYEQLSLILKKNESAIENILFLEKDLKEKCLNQAFTDLPALPKEILKKFPPWISDKDLLVIQNLFKILKRSNFKIQTLTKYEEAIYTGFFSNIVKAVNEKINKFDVREAKVGLDDLISPEKGGINLSGVPKNIKIFMEEVTRDYFKESSLPMKRLMIGSYLDSGINASKFERIGAIMHATGPIMQKFLQLLTSQRGKGEVYSVLKHMTDKILPMDFEDMDFIVNKNYPSDSTRPDFIKYMNTKSLSAGSVGQAHEGYIVTGSSEKNPVIIKILRRGIDKKFLDEITTMRTIGLKSADPRNLQMVNAWIEIVRDELTFEKEYQYLNEGYKVYEDQRQLIHVVKPISLSPHKDILVMERAQGMAMSNLTDSKYACTKAISLGKLLRTWFKETLFGSGFMHGDLHSGNIFLLPNLNYPAKSLLTIIDFGNSYKMSPIDKKSLFRFMIGAGTLSPQLIMEGIAQKNKEPILPGGVMFKGSPQKKKMKIFLSKISKDLLNGSEQATSDLFQFILENFPSLEIPNSFVNYSRSLGFISSQIEEEMAKIPPNTCKEALHPAQIQEKVVKLEILKHPGILDSQILKYAIKMLFKTRVPINDDNP